MPDTRIERDSMGEMVVPAAVVVGGECFHMAFAPVLIFGLGLGVTGAGIASTVSVTRWLVMLAFCRKKSRENSSATFAPIARNASSSLGQLPPPFGKVVL